MASSNAGALQVRRSLIDKIPRERGDKEKLVSFVQLSFALMQRMIILDRYKGSYRQVVIRLFSTWGHLTLLFTALLNVLLVARSKWHWDFIQDDRLFYCLGGAHVILCLLRLYCVLLYNAPLSGKEGQMKMKPVKRRRKMMMISAARAAQLSRTDSSAVADGGLKRQLSSMPRLPFSKAGSIVDAGAAPAPAATLASTTSSTVAAIVQRSIPLPFKSGQLRTVGWARKAKEQARVHAGQLKDAYSRVGQTRRLVGQHSWQMLDAVLNANVALGRMVAQAARTFLQPLTYRDARMQLAYTLCSVAGCSLYVAGEVDYALLCYMLDLVEFVSRSRTLVELLSALSRRAFVLFQAVALLFLVIYMYSVVGYIFFSGSFPGSSPDLPQAYAVGTPPFIYPGGPGAALPFEPYQQDAALLPGAAADSAANPLGHAVAQPQRAALSGAGSVCDNMVSCILYNWYHGLIAEGGLGRYLEQPMPWQVTRTGPPA